MRFLALAMLLVPAVSALGASGAAARDMAGHEAAEQAAPARPIAGGEHGFSDRRFSDRRDHHDHRRRFCADCVLPFYYGYYDYGYWNGDDVYAGEAPPPPPPPPPPVYRPITVEHTPEGVDIIRGPGSAPAPQGAQAQTPPAPASPPGEPKASPRPPGDPSTRAQGKASPERSSRDRPPDVTVLRGGVQ